MNCVPELNTPSDGRAKTITPAPAYGIVEEEAKFTTAERVALGDLAIRRTVAWFLVGLFAASNLFMLGFVGWLYANDQSMIGEGLIMAPDRLIDGNVVMALIAGTTVQLGAIVLTMTRGIFPLPSAGRY
jgi:hypothetical protein